MKMKNIKKIKIYRGVKMKDTKTKQKVFRLLAKDAEGGDYIELTKGSIEFCEKTRDYDNEESKKNNIAVDYKFEEII